MKRIVDEKSFDSLGNADIKALENVVVLDEFYDVYNSARGIRLCTTDVKPSEIFDLLKNNYIVVMTGDYKKAEGILWYIHHYEDSLVSGDDDAYYHSINVDFNFSAIKRLKVHRFNYVFYKNKMPLFMAHDIDENIIEWLSEDLGENYFLLPARRYMRILTDIKRANEGIKFDFISATIYISPFVYVPFDKSVPEMFMKFKKYIEGRVVIDVGTGTGILAIVAARLGAKLVTAIDINPNAVHCARNNIEKNGLSGIVRDVKCSNLFEDIDCKYDTIIFNAPWVRGEPKNNYELAIYDPDYKVITNFIEQSKRHLSDNGIILLQYSDISQKKGDGSIDNLTYLLDKHGLGIVEQISILRRNRLVGTMERVYVFAIKNL